MVGFWHGLHHFLQAELYAPLGMADTFFQVACGGGKVVLTNATLYTFYGGIANELYRANLHLSGQSNTLFAQVPEVKRGRQADVYRPD